jgi:hypothetical protein
MSRFSQTVIEKNAFCVPPVDLSKHHNKYSKDLDLHIQVPLFKKYSCGRLAFLSLALKFFEPQTNKSANSERKNLRKAYTPYCDRDTRVSVHNTLLQMVILLIAPWHPPFLKFTWLLFGAITLTHFLEKSGLCAFTWIGDQLSDRNYGYIFWHFYAVLWVVNQGRY